jgi:hypothetical protein
MNISIDAIKKAITPKQSNSTRSLIWSSAANMEDMAIAKEHNIQ